MAVPDHLKKKLGVERLNLDKKSEMFTKFRKVGGKIVEVEEDEAAAKARKLQTAISGIEVEFEDDLDPAEKKRLESAERVKQKMNKYGVSSGGSATVSAGDVEDTERQGKGKKSSNRFNVLMARLMCKLYGALRFFGNKYSRTFLYILSDRMKEIVQYGKRILSSLLYQDEEFSRSLKERLDGLGLQYHYELVFRFFHLLDDADVANLEKIKTYNAGQVNKGKPAVIKVYKQLLILKRHVGMLKDALQKAMRIEAEIRKLRQDVYVNNLRVLYKNIDFLYQTVFPRLQLLVEYFYKDEQSKGYRHRFSEYIGFTDNDRIGYYSQQWKEQEEAEKKKKELEEAQAQEEKKNEQAASEDVLDNIDMMEGVPEAAREGLRIIYKFLDFDEAVVAIQEEIDKKQFFRMDDKVFLMHSVLDFFDKQFSFLFATNLVQYNMFMDGGGKRVDLKSTFRDLYYKINSIYQRTREYVEYLGEYRKYSRATNMLISKNDPEVQRIQRNLVRVQRLIHTETKQLMEKFSQLLFVLITDMKSHKKILNNADEKVHVDHRLNTKGLFTDKTIGDVLEMSYYVSTGIQFLLADGDLMCDSLELHHPLYLKIVTLGMEEETQTDIPATGPTIPPSGRPSGPSGTQG